LEFLSEYEFEIEHNKGKENKVVYALNRRVHPINATIINMHSVDLKSRILDDVVTN
jgi:hypothetical protein